MENQLQTVLAKLRSTAFTLAVGAFASGAAQATVIGNLNDGLDHTSSVTGVWSLFVNAGDNVTVTARRLNPLDIWAVAFATPDGTGGEIAAGDDELPPYAGGSFGDPQFHFTAATTGQYSIGVFLCCYYDAGVQNSYFVNAQGATGIPDATVPLPGTVALIGLGLAGIGYTRRKQKATATA